MPIKKPRRKVYRYQKGDYESMRSDALRFAKERYFNGSSDSRSVQENFNLITSFIQDSADKGACNHRIGCNYRIGPNFPLIYEYYVTFLEYLRPNKQSNHIGSLVGDQCRAYLSLK